MAGKHETLRVYERVTAIIWQRLAPTFGIRTINAIAKNAIARTARDHPTLAQMKVTDKGLDWSAFSAVADETDDEQVDAMLADFTDEFFQAVSTLIGRLVVDKLFAEAEAEIQQEQQK